MPTRRAHPYATAPALDWSSWLKAWEISVAAPQVVAYRMIRMMWGGWPPSARDQREYARMVQEKCETLVESWTAALSAWQRGGMTVVDQSLRPMHRRVTANRRRLASARR